MFNKWKKLYKSLLSHLYEREEYIKELEEKVKELESMTSVNSRIPRIVFDKFKAKLPNTLVGDDSSPGAIGHKLGVAHVLMRMEEDLVV